MEIETPDTGTDNGTIGSLELIHEEAEEINRSMDLSLAFWGHTRDQPNMIPATKLKCVLGKPSKASETAVLIWEKMEQEELDKVKQVERVLMKDGEISTDILFRSLKNIIEGVGMTFESILSDVEAGETIQMITNIMSEILYIYNQNEPPEISETDEYARSFEDQGYIPFAPIEDDFPPMDSEEEERNDLSRRIEFLLEKAKELDLGEIKVPSTPVLSAGSKLAIVERQVKAKLRLRNIRKLIETKRNKNSNKATEGAKDIHQEKPTGKYNKSKRDINRKSVTQNSSQNRPVFRTAVKSQSLEDDTIMKQAPTLQKRLKRASLIRKKLTEEKEKIENIVDHEIKGQNVHESLKSLDAKSTQPNKKLSSIKSTPKAEINANLYPMSNPKRMRMYKRRQINPPFSQNFRSNRYTLANHYKQKVESSSDDYFKADEQIEFPMEYNQDDEKVFYNRCPENNSKRFSCFAQNQGSANIIASIRDSILEEYHVIKDDLEEEKASDACASSKQIHGELPMATEENYGQFVKDSKSINIVCECDDVEGDIVPPTPIKKLENSNRKSNTEDRPCSRDEMLSEMKKMLKEALTEVTGSNAVYHLRRHNSLEFKADSEGPSLEDRREVILERNAMSAECQTTNSGDNREANCPISCNCCERIQEETTVDIERKMEDDVVDIKITQEGCLPQTWSITGDQDRKVSTEISVSQNGSGPAVKVSVVSRVKSQENAHALVHKEGGELQHQDNVKEALNILKDYIKVNLPENSTDVNRETNDENQPHLSSRLRDSELPTINATKLEPPFMEDSVSTDFLSPVGEDLTPVSVNLAMLLQGCTCPREDLRPCGPFQIGGVLLSNTSPTKMEGDIGDGNDFQYPEPWSDFWSSHVWRENFTSPSAFTESDSLYVNTSDDVLEGVVNREDDNPIESLAVNTIEPAQPYQGSLVKMMYYKAGRFLGELFDYVKYPVTLSYMFLNSSVKKIYRRSSEEEKAKEGPNSSETSPT